MPKYQESYRMKGNTKIPYTVERRGNGTEIYSSPGAAGIPGYTFEMDPDSTYYDYHYMGSSMPPERRLIQGDDLQDIKQRQVELNQNAGPEQGWFQFNMPYTYKAAQKVKKYLGFKQGGNMNYSKYLQDGGTAEQLQSGGIEEQVMALVLAASQGDQSAQQQIQQIMQAAKSDPQAAQIAQMIQAVMQQMQGGSPQEMQDGGELGGGVGFGTALASAAGQGAASFLNTWVQGSREAEANRKATYDNGDKPITPQSQGLPYGLSPSYKRGGKTPCPCMLKRQGGRLIEIDGCTGKQIFRRGGSIQAYENAAGPIQTMGQKAQEVVTDAYGRVKDAVGNFVNDYREEWNGMSPAHKMAYEAVAPRIHEGVLNAVNTWNGMSFPAKAATVLAPLATPYIAKIDQKIQQNRNNR